jgi:hypothetical protein
MVITALHSVTSRNLFRQQAKGLPCSESFIAARMYIPLRICDDIVIWLLRHGVIAVDLNGSRPSTDDLRESFRVASEQLKTYYGLSNIPLTTVTLDTFVDMAINRKAPFEECEVASGKTQAVGLQDAAILFSITDHMKTAQEGDRCTLVSEDGIFHKAKTRKLLENAG